MINNLPAGSIYSMFSIGRFQLPYAALAPLVGANVRVGLEDNVYLSKVFSRATATSSVAPRRCSRR